MDDEKLLREAEQALTQIDRAQGLNDEHADVLAALRLRIYGAPKQTLDDALKAAGDLKGKVSLEEVEVPEKEGPSLSLRQNLFDVVQHLVHPVEDIVIVNCGGHRRQSIPSFMLFHLKAGFNVVRHTLNVERITEYCLSELVSCTGKFTQ
jgi:hypothetical protein